MSLRIRCLEIRVSTERGLYGTKLHFGDGLVVLRAENSSGKSTCLMAILLALGLEGMLGPTHVPPLSEAMVRRLSDKEDHPLKVLESNVLLEIENGRNEVMTIKRLATGTPKQRELIKTYDGAALSNPSGSFAERSFFVRIPGAAQSEVGFHTRLGALKSGNGCQCGANGWFLVLFLSVFGRVLVGFHHLFPGWRRTDGTAQMRQIFCVRFAGQPH